MKKLLAVLLAVFAAFSCLSVGLTAFAAGGKYRVDVTVCNAERNGSVKNDISVSDSMKLSYAGSAEKIYKDYIELSDALGAEEKITIDSFKSRYYEVYGGKISEDILDVLWTKSVYWAEKKSDGSYTAASTFEAGKTYTVFTVIANPASETGFRYEALVNEFQDEVSKIEKYKACSDAADDYYELLCDDDAGKSELNNARTAYLNANAAWQADTAGQSRYNELKSKLDTDIANVYSYDEDYSGNEYYINNSGADVYAEDSEVIILSRSVTIKQTLWDKIIAFFRSLFSWL